MRSGEGRVRDIKDEKTAGRDLSVECRAVYASIILYHLQRKTLISKHDGFQQRGLMCRSACRP